MAAEVLIKKGKRGAAAHFQLECSQTDNPEQLNELLDVILDPRKPIDIWDTIDWCKWLMAGGKTPDEFSQTVRRYDNATTCGLVWTANFVAYRCRTCGISPCMSLCAECFQQGNHEGHDFNMFRSQAGGACDCGDANVMKETGFCQRHASKVQEEKPPPPPDLLCVAKSMMPRVILRLVQHLREHGTSQERGVSFDSRALVKADGFLTMLHQLSEMGAIMRQVMTQTLTNCASYQHLTGPESVVDTDEEKSALLKLLNERYEEAKMTLRNWECPQEYQDITALQPILIHKSFLEELVFWMAKFEFPQKLVCFLLSMLPDPDYKEAFTQTFVQHYSRISYMLTQSTDSDTLSNRVVHVSVQLFSNEALSLRMTQHFHLLHVMVISLKAMMSLILHQSILQDPKKNFHYVVDCIQRITKDHCYWPLVSDLNNTLTHKQVAMEFLNQPNLLDMWFSLLSMFQGMNVNQRELSQHVEFEPNTYYAAFSAELEACATPLWALISHLKTEETLPLSKCVLDHCLTALEDFFDAIGFLHYNVPNPYQVTFHLPLHRYYSVFLCQAVLYQGATLVELLPDKDTLQLLMAHPLQAMVAFYEILSGMWARNGLQIKGQAMTYIQCHFCNSMVDADIFLLQLCATHLDPDWFVRTVFERFHVWEWLSFVPNRNNSFLDHDKVYPMVESALTFLAMLLGIRTNLGLSEEDIMRQEMVTLLCMGNRTHSQLTDLLPEKCGSQNKDFERFLEEVAIYKQPNFESGGNMLQGMYMPKPHIWEHEYDPVHVMLRAVHRKDFQASMDRFTHHARQSGKFKGSGTPWPPFRMPKAVHPELIDPRKLLQCKTMHAVLLIILYRALNDPEIPEQVIALTVYILEMAVRYHPHSVSPKDKLSSIHEVMDLSLSDWFPGTCLVQNSLRCVRSVVLPQPVETITSVVEEMDVDRGQESMDEDFTELFEFVSYPSLPGGSLSEDGQGSPAPLPPISQQLALPPSASSAGSGALVPVSSGTVVPSLTSSAFYNTSVLPREPLSLPGPSASTSAQNTSQASTSTSLVPRRAAPVAPAMRIPIPASPGFGPLDMASRPFRGRQLIKLASSMAVAPLGSRGSTPEDMDDSAMLAEERGIEGREPVKALPSSGRQVIDINESIVSLLLKLHSKLSGHPDSYRLPSEQPSEQSTSSEDPNENRIGAGPHFIGLVLDKLARLSTSSNPDVPSPVQEQRHKLWPLKGTSVPHSATNTKEATDREERRRRAKERQMKLMAEFANRQKSFLKKAMEIEAEDCDSMDEREPVVTVAKEYECVICSQTSPSTAERPIGMVVLLQATSVLGHAHEESVGVRKLPCSDDERFALLNDKNRASEVKSCFEQLTQHFDDYSWSQSVNIGWEGGVHVQSCGHFLHVDCHKSYMLTQRSQQNQRHQTLAVERGEYSCPLCRQLANSVLPIHPEMGEALSVAKKGGTPLRTLAQELVALVSQVPVPMSTILKAMASFMEDLTNATFGQYRSLSFLPSPHSLMLFVCSVARTNLEVELVQRGGTIGSSHTLKKSCFVPLFHVLALHAKVLTETPYARLWSHLTGLPLDDNTSSLTPLEREVPLLIRDISAVLLEIALTLPLNLDKSYYSCIVNFLYTLSYVQALSRLSFRLSESSRVFWKQKSAESQDPFGAPGSVLGVLIDHLEHSPLYIVDTVPSPEEEKELSEDELEHEVTKYSLPFLRNAALIQAHLYEEKLPSVKEQSGEFAALVQFLGLASGNKASLASSCLGWATSDPHVLLRTWCQDYNNFASKSVVAARLLLVTRWRWKQPALLELPPTYDQIFQYYHRRTCSVCNNVPKDPSICLVCSTMVCLRENCCRQQTNYEAVHHSINCGAGTAIYLAVNSSTIIVIRGKRACLWGSVYLDSFGEEDRDLKRGKPLYLSVERYKLLQQQWLSHSFDHTTKRWVWHQDNL
uniref:E3 ubiquitin-protein ligase n=1 Tax=Ornithodoros turicata TaxID=34597 RepID=A0A2R5LIR0_9ACAR